MPYKHHRTWRDWLHPANAVVHRYHRRKYPQESDSQKQEIQQRAREIIDSVRDDPEGRLGLQEEFYRKYGNGKEYGYGNSAIAFMRWEVARGVLNPLSAPNPGSSWWRNVNASFLLVNKIAELVFEAKISGTTYPESVQYWLAYLRMPTARSWYRAHNASIVRGYLDEVDTARKESSAEKIFMNEVLSRVLYAQEMVDGKAFPFGCLGPLLANSKLPAVKVMVHLPAFYPEHYPLNQEDIRNILHENKDLEDDLVRILDEKFIHPRLEHLFLQASSSLSIPGLTKFVREHRMVYPDI